MAKSKSLELVVPTGREAVRVLDSRTLYLLEQAGEIAREFLDARIVGWTREGWTQRQIAEEVGCSQQAISKRQARLGVKALDRRGGAHFDNSVVKNGDEPEPVDAEVVEDDPAVRLSRTREPVLVDYLVDMVPGAEPEGAFRQAVLAWCKQGRALGAAMDEAGAVLTPKTGGDWRALLAALADIHEVAARLERQLEQ